MKAGYVTPASTFTSFRDGYVVGKAVAVGEELGCLDPIISNRIQKLNDAP